MQVLWQYGPSTVRTVNNILNEKKRAVQYTSTLKLMQIMTDKSLVRRDENQRAHVYRARVPQQETQQQMVRDLLRRAFDDSAAQLVMQALASKKTSPQELADIRQLLDAFERGEQ